jgi:Domain of unknown function (DUF6268)
MASHFRELSFCCLGLLLGTLCKGQGAQPGLEGKAPSRWITIKHTLAPGRVYQYGDLSAKRYTQEDVYMRMWIPVIRKSNFALVVGPHYRTEQIELKSSGENPISQLDHWQLRSLGVDVKSFAKLTDNSWLLMGGHVNQSVNLGQVSDLDVPLNYSMSSIFLKRVSDRKEIGAGLIVNKSKNLTVLPVFMFNYNFSSRSGLEITLPQKISWRNNLSSTDILYVKAEASTRTYYINGMGLPNEIFRRIDADLGVAYNKQFNSFIGMEFFSGYRKNLACRLPEGVTPIKKSGFVASLELYIKAPKISRK